MQAKVVCRQLGYSAGGVTALRHTYGQGTGMIWLSNLQCSGSEMTISECRHDGFGQQKHCTHNDDAAVMCYPNYAL